MSFHLFFISTFLLLDPSIHLSPPFMCSVFCPLPLSELATALGKKTHEQTPTAPLSSSSHTAINLCIDSPLHFHTVWTELKHDESFRRVHCFPHALVVYTGVLQTTSAQLRNWMYQAQSVRGAQQLSALFPTISEPGFSLLPHLFLLADARHPLLFACIHLYFPVESGACTLIENVQQILMCQNVT